VKRAIRSFLLFLVVALTLSAQNRIIWYFPSLPVQDQVIWSNYGYFHQYHYGQCSMFAIQGGWWFYNYCPPEIFVYAQIKSGILAGAVGLWGEGRAVAPVYHFGQMFIYCNDQEFVWGEGQWWDTCSMSWSE
jgi:hypothetical protein